MRMHHKAREHSFFLFASGAIIPVFAFIFTTVFTAVDWKSLSEPPERQPKPA